MEMTHALLVSLMFVTILSLGIANILASLPAVFERCSELRRNKIYISWLILLLLGHFILFWQTLDIVSVQKWRFAGFLYVIAGPILLFFATNTMLPKASETDFNRLREYYFKVSPRFFWTLAVLLLWNIGVDFVFGSGFTRAGALNTATLVLALALATSQQPRRHEIGTGVAWILFGATLILRGIGVIG